MQWHLIQLKCGERGFLSSVWCLFTYLFTFTNWERTKLCTTWDSFILCITGSEGGSTDAAFSESKSSWWGISETLHSPPRTHHTSQETTQNWTHWSSGHQNPPAGSWCSQGVRYGRPFSLCVVVLVVFLFLQISIVMFYSQRRTGPNSLMIGSKVWWSYFGKHLLSWLARFLVVNWIRIFNTWRCFWRPFRISIRWFFFNTLDQICILIYHCIIVVYTLLWRSAAVLTETSQTGIWSFMRSMIY